MLRISDFPRSGCYAASFVGVLCVTDATIVPPLLVVPKLTLNCAQGPLAVERTAWLIREALTGVRALHNPLRHVVIVASMVAMYLTKDSSRAAESKRRARRLARSGGTLTRALIPVVRAWRVLYALRCS